MSANPAPAENAAPDLFTAPLAASDPELAEAILRREIDARPPRVGSGQVGLFDPASQHGKGDPAGERLGERGCVFIVTKGNTALRLFELTQFLGAAGMAKPYWPERLEILPEMPRTPSGKIQKFKLRAMAADLRPEAMQR